MGEVIRKSKSGRFIGWYVRYVDSDGKRKTRATKAATAAEARRIDIKLEAPPGRHTRPTTDRVREAWMSALQPELPGATVLDLFAGSGALAMEALSRGAARVVFV